MGKSRFAICLLSSSFTLLLSGCALHRDEFEVFRSASTVRLEVELDISGFGDSVWVHTAQGGFAVRTRAGPPQLPFAEIAGALLKCAGLRVVEGEAEDGDFTFEIRARGRALMREYSPKSSKTDLSAADGPDPYSGNRTFVVPSGLFLEGTVSLEAPGVAPHQKVFRGEASPPADMTLDLTHSPFSSRPLFLEYDRASGRTACNLLGSFTQKAVETLGEAFGIPFLLAAISSQPPPIDAYAEKALSGVEVDRADEDLLIAALQRDANRRIRRLAAKAMGKTAGKRAVPALIAALRDDEWRVRQTAAETLGERGGRRVVEPLIVALDDQEWHVRRAAAEALVAMGGRRVVEPLIAALDDQEWRVRLLVAGNLGEMGDRRAVEPLIAALDDEEFGVRYHAVLALQKLADPRAVGPLIAALDDEDVHFRNRVVMALKKLTGREIKAPEEWRAWWRRNEERH